MKVDQNSFKKMIGRVSFFVALFLFWQIFGFSSGVSAADINVVAGTSSGSNDGQCQLYEAIEVVSLQSNISYPDCTNPDGNNDTINLPAGTITLGANLPQIRSSVKIKGTGVGSSIIDGNGKTRMFYTDFLAQGVNLQFEDLSATNIVNGSGGGSCFYARPSGTGSSNASVSLKRINMDNCYYGLNIGTAGNLDVTGVTTYIEDVDMTAGANGASGVGVYANDLALLDMQSVTISGYDTGLSGFVVKDDVSNYTIKNSTFYGNKIGVNLGVYVSQSCGTCGPTLFDVNFYNNTIYGNSNTGSYNAAGIRIPTGGAGLNLEFANNLIAENTVSGVTDNCDFGARYMLTSVSLGGNLSDDDCSGLLDSADDLVNISGITGFSAVLQDNGGPVRTMSIEEDSLLFDAGVTLADAPSDARGIARPQGDGYDIGAFELEVASTPVDPPPDDNNNNDNNDNDPIVIGLLTIPGVPRTGALMGSVFVLLAAVLLTSAVAVEVGWTEHMSRLKHLKRRPKPRS